MDAPRLHRLGRLRWRFPAGRPLVPLGQLHRVLRPGGETGETVTRQVDSIRPVNSRQRSSAVDSSGGFQGNPAPVGRSRRATLPPERATRRSRSARKAPSSRVTWP